MRRAPYALRQIEAGYGLKRLPFGVARTSFLSYFHAFVSAVTAISSQGHGTTQEARRYDPGTDAPHSRTTREPIRVEGPRSWLTHQRLNPRRHEGRRQRGLRRVGLYLRGNEHRWRRRIRIARAVLLDRPRERRQRESSLVGLREIFGAGIVARDRIGGDYKRPIKDEGNIVAFLAYSQSDIHQTRPAPFHLVVKIVQQIPKAATIAHSPSARVPCVYPGTAVIAPGHLFFLVAPPLHALDRDHRYGLRLPSEHHSAEIGRPLIVEIPLTGLGIGMRRHLGRPQYLGKDPTYASDCIEVRRCFEVLEIDRNGVRDRHASLLR